MVAKPYHEVRDPIHNFIRLDSDERRILDSYPVQRLRHVHQLAMSYLVYPGATHRRFEHSLGVMELAGRVFDVVTTEANIHPSIKNVVPELRRPDTLSYWRKVLRMAALCHDIGQLPFSHAAETELLPDSWDHERFTAKLIEGDELDEIFQSMRPLLDPKDVAKIAVGPEKADDTNFSNWEALLFEIISGDALGVDRMDYLIRDSHHAGVAYGKFDHHRLVDTMRILPASQQADEPALGVERGGLHSAEALLLARYFMFRQVYYHHVRVAYDFHLQQFLQAWLPDARFSTDIDKHQQLTDNEVLSAISDAAEDPSRAGHEAADRIVNRKHFRVLYEITNDDREKHEHPLDTIFEASVEEFGKKNVHKVEYIQQRTVSDFPVRTTDDKIVSSHLITDVLNGVSLVDIGIVLVAPDIENDALNWLGENRVSILSQNEGG